MKTCQQIKEYFESGVDIIKWVCYIGFAEKGRSLMGRPIFLVGFKVQANRFLRYKKKIDGLSSL